MLSTQKSIQNRREVVFFGHESKTPFEPRHDKSQSHQQPVEDLSQMSYLYLYIEIEWKLTMNIFKGILSE